MSIYLFMLEGGLLKRLFSLLLYLVIISGELHELRHKTIIQVGRASLLSFTFQILITPKPNIAKAISRTECLLRNERALNPAFVLDLTHVKATRIVFNVFTLIIHKQLMDSVVEPRAKKTLSAKYRLVTRWTIWDHSLLINGSSCRSIFFLF